MTDQLERGLGIDDLLKDKREEILRIAEQHKAYNVRVFGSVARGEAAPDSDVDFLVDFRPDASLWDHVRLWQDLTALLDRDVDVSTPETLREGVRPNALRDAVPL